MAVEQKNLCVFLSSRPGVSNPPTEANFSVKHTEVKSCEDGEVLLKTLFLSVDPYMRCRLNEESGASYVSSWKIGETLQGGGVGVVVESRNESFKAGDVVQSMAWPWQTYAVFFKETESWMSQPTKVSPRPCHSQNQNYKRVCMGPGLDQNLWLLKPLIPKYLYLNSPNLP